MIGWRPKTFLICGGLVLLVAIGSELYKLNTELKYDNLGSDLALGASNANDL